MKAQYKAMKSHAYQLKKNKRMKTLREACATRNINSARDYLVVANSISGKDRIDSRVRVIKKGTDLEYVNR